MSMCSGEKKKALLFNLFVQLFVLCSFTFEPLNIGNHVYKWQSFIYSNTKYVLFEFFHGEAVKLISLVTDRWIRQSWWANILFHPKMDKSQKLLWSDSSSLMSLSLLILGWHMCAHTHICCISCLLAFHYHVALFSRCYPLGWMDSGCLSLNP